VHQSLPASLQDEIGGIAGSVGCELFQIEIKGNVLRVVLDREDGPVTLDDCSTVSRQVSALLDVMDYSTAHYVLEVSSPGLDRPLLSARDWQRFVGSLAKVTFVRPKEEGSAETVKRTVTARITSFDAANAIAHLEVNESQEHLELPLATISRAKLEIEI
jgi:ribosome maturation factor RimP